MKHKAKPRKRASAIRFVTCADFAVFVQDTNRDMIAMRERLDALEAPKPKAPAISQPDDATITGWFKEELRKCYGGDNEGHLAGFHYRDGRFRRDRTGLADCVDCPPLTKAAIRATELRIMRHGKEPEASAIKLGTAYWMRRKGHCGPWRAAWVLDLNWIEILGYAQISHTTALADWDLREIIPPTDAAKGGAE